METKFIKATIISKENWLMNKKHPQLGHTNFSLEIKVCENKADRTTACIFFYKNSMHSLIK